MTYDQKDTGDRKLLRRTEHFRRNVTIFAGDLSKACRQLMRMRADGIARAIAAIFS
jgi:hypothetical protein